MIITVVLSNIHCFDRLVGDCLFTLHDYNKWVSRRKFLDPSFHRSRLHQSVDSFNLTGDKFIEQLSVYAESGESFSLGLLFHKVTLDIIMRVSTVEKHDRPTMDVQRSVSPPPQIFRRVLVKVCYPLCPQYFKLSKLAGITAWSTGYFQL